MGCIIWSCFSSGPTLVSPSIIMVAGREGRGGDSESKDGNSVRGGREKERKKRVGMFSRE